MKTTSPLIGPLANCSWVMVAVLGLLIGALFGSADAVAQGTRAPHIQVGAGVIPGIGFETGYISPRSFYTVEGVLYVDGAPSFAGGEGSVEVAGGIGGAVRILGILRTIGSPGYVGRDFDFGFRFGPALFFTLGESSRQANPFSLFLEPFLRATSTFGSDRIFFAELGIRRPILRAGIWFEL